MLKAVVLHVLHLCPADLLYSLNLAHWHSW
jgi:hypothetical protein